MQNKPKSLHVYPVGENWEVESDAITLGQTETKSEAIELVEELASAAEVSNIAVHFSDGLVETEFQWVNQPKTPVSFRGTERGVSVRMAPI